MRNGAYIPHWRGEARGRGGSSGRHQALAWPNVGIHHGLDNSDLDGDKMVMNKETVVDVAVVDVTCVTVRT
jgi:hypothetical protein